MFFVSRKDFIKLLEFICSVGGIVYYQELYDKIIKNNCNLSDGELFEEIKSISSLFKGWVKEFTWAKEDLEYMNSIISITK